MDRIAVDVTAVNEAKGLWTVAADTAQRSITISYTGVDSQFAQVVVRGSAEYFTHYPHGSLSFLLQDDFFVIQASTSMTVPQLCMHVHGIITAPRREDGMGAPRATMESDDSAGSPSWSMEPTMEYAADDTKTGVNNSLLEDIAVLGEMVTVADMPPIGKLVATVWVPLKTLLTKTELEAYALDTNAPIGIRLTFDRQHYKVAPIQVAVGNASHFKQGQYPPTCVQLSSILASFVSQFVIVSRVSASSLSPLQSLLDLGFEEAQATKALRMAGDDLRTACAILMSDTVDEFNAASAEAKDQKAVKTAYKGVKTPAEIKAFPTEKNLFTACAVYLQQRITSLATFCVICDRTHVFAGSSMMMPTVCSRELCVFRFRKLDVARDAATSVAVQTGVVDLLFNIARAAAKSDRWKNIFQPFPSVPSPDKNPGLDPRNPDAALAARILDKIPSLQVISGVDSTAQLQALLTKAHPLAQGLFDWIVSSNKSHIVKLPAQEHLTFMGTRHQYLFVSSTPERHAAFNELKKKHGSLWAFHGSRAENWHSILRNGLKNASGTALQVNGAAYGSGIYLSPNASTSFGYSQLNSGTTEAQRDAHLKADFIDYDSMRCIAICEVVQHELRQSGSIWVQPHEHCVLTRFLFVYTHSFAEGYNVDLNADVYKRLLSDLCARYFEM